MAETVRRVEAHGVHGRFNLTQEFEPGVNVLFGRNGAGKTTLLHILANVLNSEYERFAFLEFRRVTVTLDDDTRVSLRKRGLPDDPTIEVTLPDRQTIEIRQRDVISRERTRAEGPEGQLQLFESADIERREPVLRVAYFPAFRTMIEAWASIALESPGIGARVDRDPDLWHFYFTRTARRRRGEPLS
jgi:energy-coupling factor transporter ATP-binding protein EcfA2